MVRAGSANAKRAKMNQDGSNDDEVTLKVQPVVLVEKQSGGKTFHKMFVVSLVYKLSLSYSQTIKELALICTKIQQLRVTHPLLKSLPGYGFLK